MADEVRYIIPVVFEDERALTQFFRQKNDFTGS